jgi:Uma2 family endonuclease
MEPPPLASEKEVSWDEYLALPYETRNSYLVDGRVIVNSPNAPHELVVHRLVLAFFTWKDAGPGRGEVSTQQPVKINDRRGYQPDFAWYPVERCAPLGEPMAFRGDPGLVVEVLSPSTRRTDLIRKRGDYDAIGVAEVWFVDPKEREVLVCQRIEQDSPLKDVVVPEGGTITTPLLDGLEIPVADLFRR